MVGVGREQDLQLHSLSDAVRGGKGYDSLHILHWAYHKHSSSWGMMSFYTQSNKNHISISLYYRANMGMNMHDLPLSLMVTWASDDFTLLNTVHCCIKKSWILWHRFNEIIKKLVINKLISWNIIEIVHDFTFASRLGNITVSNKHKG